MSLELYPIDTLYSGNVLSQEEILKFYYSDKELAMIQESSQWGDVDWNRTEWAQWGNWANRI